MRPRSSWPSAMAFANARTIGCWRASKLNRASALEETGRESGGFSTRDTQAQGASGKTRLHSVLVVQRGDLGSHVIPGLGGSQMIDKSTVALEASRIEQP